jgi:putative YphP/YqiW family bacilliredoxin
MNVPYDETMVAPMRAEVSRLGVKEMRTAADVDAELKDLKGTALVFVNSVCGCAAGGARPGLTLALRHAKKPTKVTTVFAGQDGEATQRARSYFTGYAPSSPSMGLLKDGKLVWMMQRHDIEGRMPQDIAAKITEAFEKYC